MRPIYVAALGMAGIMVAATAYGRIQAAAPGNWGQAESVVDANGNLHVPHEYRTTYQFLGSWAVANDHGQGAKQVHIVYASPGTIAAYHKPGVFLMARCW